MVQGTIKITKNLNPPCWTFMTACTLIVPWNFYKQNHIFPVVNHALQDANILFQFVLNFLCFVAP
jgi:hypothetical protein